MLSCFRFDCCIQRTLQALHFLALVSCEWRISDEASGEENNQRRAKAMEDMVLYQQSYDMNSLRGEDGMWLLRSVTEALTTILQAREARKRVRVPLNIVVSDLFS